MKSKKIASKWIVRIDKGEEVVETLKNFCKEKGIKLGSISGIGATNKVVIGLFNTGEKKYYKKELTGDFEITNLSGNISTMNGEVYLHIHINLSDSEFTTFGGHLNSSVISGTCEIIIEEIDGEIEREFNEEVGLNLYKM
ncbi:MAG: uncharacterized protein PWQ96_41 [Clostridia bacterium]|nr:hypothetical protein [Clostridiales bacterium]MDK2984399.1 uncharacterized protein [Clostridia bacterium]